MNLIVRFWREYASHHQWSYALGVLFLFITNGLGVLIPKLIQWAIEAFEREDSALHLAVALLGAGMGTVRTYARSTFIFNQGEPLSTRSNAICLLIFSAYHVRFAKKK